jgi:outer membrane protein TolC
MKSQRIRRQLTAILMLLAVATSAPARGQEGSRATIPAAAAPGDSLLLTAKPLAPNTAARPPGESAAAAPAAGLRLAEALELALGRSPAVREAEAASEAARAAAGPLNSAYLPGVAAQASYLRSQYPTTITPIREIGAFPPLDDEIYDLTFSLSWTVFDFGRGSSARRSAKALAGAAGVRYDLARMEAIESVTEYFVRLAQLRDVATAQRQRLEALNRQRDTAEMLLAEGRVPQVELLRLDEVFLQAEVDLRRTENDRRAVLDALAAITGSPEPIEDVVFIDISEPPASAPFREATPPAVAAAEAQLAAAEASAAAAGRALLPEVELYAAERLRSGSPIDVDAEWMAGVRLRIPLFQPKAHARRQVEQARVREQEAALERARDDYAVALREIEAREAERAAQIRATEARVRHLDETLRIETAAYEEGRMTLSDLLTTDARLSAGRSELAAARAGLVLLRLRGAVLTGTLTPERALALSGE